MKCAKSRNVQNLRPSGSEGTVPGRPPSRSAARDGTPSRRLSARRAACRSPVHRSRTERVRFQLGAGVTDDISKVSSVNDRLVWIDCEMTGLDPIHDALIEVAALVTDFELNVL